LSPRPIFTRVLELLCVRLCFRYDSGHSRWGQHGGSRRRRSIAARRGASTTPTTHIPSLSTLVLASKRCAPLESVEPCVIPIGGNPFATIFHRQCGEPGILRDVAVGFGLLADGLKNCPMPVARHNDRCIGLFEQGSAEIEDVIQCTRRFEYSRVRADSHYAGEHLGCNAVSGSAVDRRLEPRLVRSMVVGV